MVGSQAEVEIVGVYPVAEASEPCHLVEVVVDGARAFSIAEVTQERAGEARSEWQVPWDEKVLDDRGERIVAHAWELPKAGELPAGTTRLVFFFHYLDSGSPFTTPWGAIDLPEPSPRPERLAIVEYEEP